MLNIKTSLHELPIFESTIDSGQKSQSGYTSGQRVAIVEISTPMETKPDTWQDVLLIQIGGM